MPTCSDCQRKPLRSGLDHNWDHSARLSVRLMYFYWQLENRMKLKYGKWSCWCFTIEVFWCLAGLYRLCSSHRFRSGKYHQLGHRLCQGWELHCRLAVWPRLKDEARHIQQIWALWERFDQVRSTYKFQHLILFLLLGSVIVQNYLCNLQVPQLSSAILLVLPPH